MKKADEARIEELVKLTKMAVLVEMHEVMTDLLQKYPPINYGGNYMVGLKDIIAERLKKYGESVDEKKTPVGVDQAGNKPAPGGMVNVG